MSYKEKQNKTLISVIIPIYNAEESLVLCIESIIKQSHEKIEIILINDGSTDTSLDICNTYKNRDDRIIIINKKNGGAAQARNQGIDISQGEYICFIDSDDYVDIDFIKVLLDNIKKHKADISACSYYRIYKNKKPIISDKPNFIKFNNISAIKDTLLDNSVLEVILCNKLFKRDLFIKNNIKLPEGDIYEDSRTIYKLLYYSNTIVFDNDPLYYYVQRPNSVMHHKANIRNLSLQLMITSEMSNWLNEREAGLEQELESYSIAKQIDAIGYMIDNKEIIKEMWTNLSKDVRNNLKYIMTSHHLSKKRKITAIIIVLGKHPYIFMRKTFKIISSINSKGANNGKA